MRFRFVAFFLACAAASACTTAPPPPPPPPPPAPLPPPPPPIPVVDADSVVIQGSLPEVQNAQVARAYLTPTDVYRPFQGNLPFGLLLLKNGDTARNQAVCSAFVNGIPSVVDAQSADPNAAIILTYWLLKQPIAFDKLTDCPTLLSNYDFSRAAKLRNSYGRAAAAGPVFVGLQLNEGILASNGTPEKPYVALLDLSSATPANAGIITATWFQQVSTPDEDRSSAPDYVPEKKGRGWFQKLVAIAGRLATEFSCSVLKSDAPPAGISETSLAVFDPEYKLAIGTVRLFVHSNKIVGFGANLLATMVCPTTTAGLSHGMVRISQPLNVRSKCTAQAPARAS